MDAENVTTAPTSAELLLAEGVDLVWSKWPVGTLPPKEVAGWATRVIDALNACEEMREHMEDQT